MAPFACFCTCILLFLVSVVQAQEQQEACSVENNNPSIEENNAPGIVVTNITTADGITVTIEPTMDYEWFEINGSQLILKHSVDYELITALVVQLNCRSVNLGITVNSLIVVLSIENVNDNPPVFKETNITVQVNEDTVVNTVVVPQANVTATDADGDVVFYNLTGSPMELEYFNIQGVNNPQIVLYKALDYDTINLMEFILYAMDGDTSETALHTATAEITIHIIQADRRPPWFQPCTLFAGRTVCINRGYTGKVNVSEDTTEPVILKPGHLYAIDGDTSLNETIVYEIAEGNDDNTFLINYYTGYITMNNPVHTLKTFMLYIVASQENNPFRYSQTTVEIEVVRKNNHKPYFNTSYSGIVSVQSPISSIVMETDSPSVPIMIFAIDEDFPPHGYNPDIIYKIQNSTAFRVTSDGFILTTEVLKEVSTVTLWAIANDTSTLEEASTLITIDVTPLSATTVPTTTITTTTTISASTTAFPDFPGTGTTSSEPSSSSSNLPPEINSTLTVAPSESTKSVTSLAGTTKTPGIMGTTGKPVAATTSSPITRTTQLPPIVKPTVGTVKSTAQPGTTKSYQTSISWTTGGIVYSTTLSSSQINTTKPPIPGESSATVRTTESITKTSQAGSTKPSTAGLPVAPNRTVPTNSLTTSQIQTTKFPIIGEISKPGVTTQATATSSQSGSTKSSTTGDTIEYDRYVKDMAALGGTLGSLLIIALILLGVISYKYYKMKHVTGEDNINPVEGYSNDNFESNENLIGGRSDDELPVSAEADSDPTHPSEIAEESRHVSDASEAIEEDEEGGEGPESEKEVRSILTKDRRMEDDGYKAVWFKEDIDPEAKEDVVMIEEDLDVERTRSDGDNGDDSDDDEDNDRGRGGSDMSIVVESAPLPETSSTVDEFLEEREAKDIHL